MLSISSTLALGLALVSTAVAMPAGDSASSTVVPPPSLASRQTPIYTTDQIKSMFMANNKPDKDTCFFYVGPFREKAITWAVLNGGVTLYDIYYKNGDDNYPFDSTGSPFQEYLEQGQKREWFQVTSRAYAQVCSGTAYFVWDGSFPLSNADPKDTWTSIWLTDELDAILKGETGIDSSKIIQVDPQSGAQKPYIIPQKLKREVNVPADKVRRSSPTDPADPNSNPDVEGTIFVGGTGSGFVPGSCGIHIVQYQKPDPSTDNYTFDITVKDADGFTIGSATGLNLATDQSSSITGPLPYTVDITAGAVDDDPVRFAYAGNTFDTNSGQCSIGSYDSGSRQGDCGFTCT